MRGSDDDPAWGPEGDESFESATGDLFSDFDTGEFESLADPDHGFGDDLDDDASRRPLPPEDRVWHHPSELRYLTGEPDRKATGGSSVRALAGVAVAGGMVGAVLAVVGGALFIDEPSGTTVVERRLETTVVPVSAINTAGPDVRAIAEAVRPAITRLEVSRDGRVVSTGSGVLFRDDGHLLTNAHVVEGGDEVRVVLDDGQELPGEVIGADTLTDVAVVRIELSGGPTAILGTTDGVEVGQWAVALGSPLGLEGGATVTLGVVSALGRELRTESGDVLYELIQTDAPIAPGSSGGALVDARGAVVGITTAIAISEVGAEGLGFATPIDVAVDVADDLLRYGRVDHAWLGVRGRDADPEALAGTRRAGGVTIIEVVDEGPAARSDLRPGDLVLALDDEPLATMGELIVRLRAYDPGSEVLLTVLRDGEEHELPLVLGTLPDG